MGVGVPVGSEANVHAARRFPSNMPPDNIFVKLDFSMHSIAYTEIICWKESVRWFRGFTNFVIWRVVTILRFNLAIFLFRQRSAPEPLGGFSFCLAIHPILRSTSSPLTMSFMDDVSLGGPLSTVSSDVDLFRREGVLEICRRSIADQSASGARQGYEVLSRFGRATPT